MDKPHKKPPHIVFLFSDTGGGHRSAAEAIIEALNLEYGHRISAEMVDILKDYAPNPLNKAAEFYPKLVRAPQAWGLGYRISNGDHRVQLILLSALPYVRKSIRALIADYPCDMIVSVHPLANRAFLRVLGENRPTFATVVTDLVTTHAFWYSHLLDLCVVPTEEARQRALLCGMKPEQLELVGLPVADRFCQPPGDKQQLRANLGWPLHRPTVLLVGGGEGMGPLEKTARVIAAQCPGITLVVVTGRNQSLKEKLQAMPWPAPTYIYGFVREMPDFMRAADILVTKAGPGTICEGLIAGLPIVLYSRVPGQEDGNVTYLVSGSAGVWAPQPEQIVSAINEWVENPFKREQAAAASRRLARPQAARQIARLLAQRLKVDHPNQAELPGSQASRVQ